MRCAVVKCSQNNKNSSCSKKVHYLSFPKNAKEQEIWAKFCGREDAFNFASARICSLHFREEDFEQDLQFEMGFRKCKRVVLKTGVVPTIMLAAIKKESTSATAMPMNSSAELCPEIKPKTDFKNEIKLLKDEIKALRMENNLLEQNTCELSKTNDRLQSQIAFLRQINKNVDKSLSRIFTEGQISKLKAGDKRRVWQEDDLARSFTLYSTSPKAYELMWKRKFPLPAIRTLQRWSQKQEKTIGVIKAKKRIIRKNTIAISRRNKKKTDKTKKKENKKILLR